MFAVEGPGRSDRLGRVARPLGRRRLRCRSTSRTRVRVSCLSAAPAPTKLRTKSSAGSARIRSGSVVLHDFRACLQDRDPVAELDGLVEVVGHEDDGLAELLLQPQELVLQPLAG